MYRIHVDCIVICEPQKNQIQNFPSFQLDLLYVFVRMDICVFLLLYTFSHLKRLRTALPFKG